MKQTINKSTVIDFYKKVIGEQDIEFANKIIAENYIQHNPHVKTGKEGFLEAIEFLKQLPKPQKPLNPFRRIIAENEYVVVHYKVEIGGQKKIVLDMFRLENGVLAEHWDAIKDEAETTLNGNPEIEGTTLIEEQENTTLNKETIEKFSNQIMINKKFETIKSFVDQDVIQHNPILNNGLSSIAEYYQDIKILKVYKTIGQGNFVVTQSKGIINNEDFVFYDIFRLKNRRIVETWSVSQIIPKTMAHKNGMI